MSTGLVMSGSRTEPMEPIVSRDESESVVSNYSSESEDSSPPGSTMFSARGFSFASAKAAKKFELPEHRGPTVIVVDPYTSGASLAELVANDGYTVVSLMSDPTSARAKSATFVGPVVKHLGDPSGVNPTSLQVTIGMLRAVSGEIKAVMAGAEEGVELADRLADALGLPHNGLTKTEARRNKWDMMEAVREAGLRAAEQSHVMSCAEAEQFFARVSSDWIVMKPLASMKSEDVFLCKSLQDVQDAYHKIAGKRNFLNVENRGALAQEFLDGDEYVVDSVSLNGKHKVNCLFAIDRGYANGQFNVMFGARLMDPTSLKDSFLANQIVFYAFGVLDALEVRNGCGHMELKVTSKGEVCLVEMGARPCGDPVSPLLDVCLNRSQIRQAADAALNPSFFENFYGNMQPKPRFGGRQSFVVSHFEGVVEDVNVEALEAIPSVKQINMFVKPGDTVEKTIDQRTQLGYMLMWHPDEATLARDYETVRKLEQTPGALLRLRPL